MKIKSIEKVKLDHDIPVYDVVDAGPWHNFLAETPTGFVPLHNCGLLDEVDFVHGQSAKMEESKVMKMYTNVKRRMESRYQRRGEIPGVLFLVSSKKSEHDFLEQYAKRQANNPSVLIVDEPLWNVKPKENYSGKMFYVAVGNQYVKSKIINDTEDIHSYEKQNYRVLPVPVEHRQAFELDIDSALMDIAGISATSKSKFISYERLKLNYTNRINPFKAEVLSIGMNDSLEISDFFVPDLISEEIRSLPGFMHLDTSLTGDHTGISYVVVSGTKAVDKYLKDYEGGGAYVEENQMDLVYRQVFTIGISAPSDSEISFEKTRQFIYHLKRDLGFNLREVSVDGFQSADTRQQLLNAGIKSSLHSLDKSNTPYMVFKNAINEERLDLLRLGGSVLEREIIELEMDGLSGKIDHPTSSEYTGSKDESDSLCGAVYLASINNASGMLMDEKASARMISDTLAVEAAASTEEDLDSIIMSDYFVKNETTVVKKDNDKDTMTDYDIFNQFSTSGWLI